SGVVINRFLDLPPGPGKMGESETWWMDRCGSPISGDWASWEPAARAREPAESGNLRPHCKKRPSNCKMKAATRDAPPDFGMKRSWVAGAGVFGSPGHPRPFHAKIRRGTRGDYLNLTATRALL